MKRNYKLNVTCAALFGSCSMLFAQTEMLQNTVIEREINYSNFQIQDSNIPETDEPSTAAVLRSYWLDYKSAYADAWGTTPSRSGSYLFPDTVVRAIFPPSTVASPFIHSIAQVFDPTAEIFSQQGITIDGTKGYDLDSIRIDGRYARVNNVVDTLVVNVVSNLQKGVIYYKDAAIKTAYGQDSVFAAPIVWDFNTKKVVGQKATYKIPLDAAFYADSVDDGFRVFHTAKLDVNVKCAGAIAITVDFLPGSSWTGNDTLLINKNAWLFDGYELNGTNTYRSYDPNDYNGAYVLNSAARYNSSTQFYTSAYAFSQAFSLETMGIRARIMQDNNLIPNSVSDPKLVNSNVQVYPNPTNGQFTLRFSDDLSGVYMFNLTNMLGQNVLSEKIAISSGTTKGMNLSTLEKGVYFLSVEGVDFSETQKIIIK